MASDAIPKDASQPAAVPSSASGSASIDADGNVPAPLQDVEESVAPSGTSRARKIPQIHGQSFTVRGVLVGLLVGLVICFSNMYFGLQTGWVSTMTMPASLMGFGTFKLLSRHRKFPFSPVENVLVQTVAGSMAIMPLGCGFVGVVSYLTCRLGSVAHHSPLLTRGLVTRHELPPDH